MRPVPLQKWLSAAGRSFIRIPNASRGLELEEPRFGADVSGVPEIVAPLFDSPALVHRL
jgi:hypothetical protein